MAKTNKPMQVLIVQQMIFLYLSKSNQMLKASFEYLS